MPGGGGGGGGAGTGGRSLVSARAYTAIWALSLASSLSRAEIFSIVTTTDTRCRE